MIDPRASGRLRVGGLLLLLLMFMTVLAFRKANTDPVKWVLTKQCTLKVNGSTNINRFSCIIPEYTSPDTLICYKENRNDPVKVTGSMALDVQKFDCNHPVMTNDLRKTLKAKVYPKIIIKFLNLSKYPEFYNREETIKGGVTIELAGTVKRFEVDYKYILSTNGNLKLVGTKQVNFSDFNIIPPRKLGGMIKTNNQLNVEFVLNVKIIN